MATLTIPLRPAPTGYAEDLTTIANAVTLLRTIVAVPLGVWAVATGHVVPLVIGYVVYWLGDMADGWTARRFGQETRIGAVLDIICDRACTAVLCAGLVVLRPELWLVAAVFLLSFMMIDTMLSLAFLCWPIVSPNHFDTVDRATYAWNWSPLAKATNTSAVIITAVAGWVVVASVIALAVLAVKLWSVRRVARLIRAGR